MDNEIKSLIREYIRFLDIVEESEEGRIFRPNQLGSCRVLDGKRMNEILIRLKELVKE